MSDRKTCCRCGALITDRGCLACDHRQCENCPDYISKPTYQALLVRLDAIHATLIQAGYNSVEELVGAYQTKQARIEELLAEKGKSQWMSR